MDLARWKIEFMLSVKGSSIIAHKEGRSVLDALFENEVCFLLDQI